MPHKDPSRRREYQRAYGQGYYERNRDAVREKHRAHYERASEQVIARQMEHYEQNKDRILADRRARYARDKQRVSEYRRRRRVGDYVNRVQTERRLRGLPEPTRAIPPLCECCGKPPGKLALALDHCHRTGAFRGWLCGKCNTGIGMLGDTQEGLLRAMAYLKRVEGDL